jgi:hypothetical protein
LPPTEQRQRLQQMVVELRKQDRMNEAFAYLAIALKPRTHLHE